MATAKPTQKTFTATLTQDPDSAACGIALPFNPKDLFGKARAPVTATINGHTWRTTTAPMSGSFWIPVSKPNRTAAGIAPGDKVTVTLALDDQPRVVKPPTDLAAALRADPTAAAAWKKLSYTHQKEHVQALVDARKPETRQRRLAKTLEMLLTPKR